MALKVLHLLDHSVPLHSGYAFRTLALLKEQNRLGIETIQVTSSKHYGSTAAEEDSHGFHFFRTIPRASWSRSVPVLNQAMDVRDTARRLEQIARRTRPDVIHAHSPALGGMAALQVAGKLDIAVVYEMRASWEDAAVDHGTTTRGSLRYRVSRWLESRVFRRVDAITTICEGLRTDIIDRGIAPEFVTVVPNAVDVADFPAIAERDAGLASRLGLQDGPVLGFIGSFYGYEGLDDLLQAVPGLVGAHPALRVLLVGGGPMEQALRRQATALGVADRVLFAGRVPHDEVQRYYSVIDLLVYPRKATRLTELVTPLKPLEAMAQGRMFMASDVGGHRELMPSWMRDQLFRPGNARDLAAVTLRLLEWRGGWEEPLARAMAHVQEQRTWQKSASVYPQVYAAALSRRRAPDA